MVKILYFNLRTRYDTPTSKPDTNNHRHQDRMYITKLSFVEATFIFVKHFIHGLRKSMQWEAHNVKVITVDALYQ